MTTVQSAEDELYPAAEALWADKLGPESHQQSVELFHRLYDLGDRTRACYRLGIAYFLAKGVSRDLDRAYEYLSAPELNQVRFALYFRGLVLNDPRFKGFNEGSALKAFRAARALGVTIADEPIAAIENRHACPICNATTTTEAQAPSTCPECGSSAVQRVFMSAYRNNLHYHYSLSDKKGLVLRSSGAVHKLFSKIEPDSLTTLDIPADAQVDIVSSISGMRLRDEEFDFVFAEDVLGRSKDMDASLAEFHRVLKPGGVLISMERGTLDQAGGLLGVLKTRFQTQVFPTEDPLLKVEISVFANRKPTSDLLASPARLKYVDEIVERNKINEMNSGCEFSRRYSEEKTRRPEITYASFAVAIEAEAVARNAAHATLGLNISERSKQQGDETFEFYKNVLQVRSEHRVVEYGCGSLRVGVGFVHLLGPNQFFGLDVVPTFYELGCQRIGRDVIRDKGVRFHTIDEDGIRLASAFQADHVYAPAVLFHIHPDDIEDAARNLASLTSKPGAKLIFDGKITREAGPRRYAQMGDKGGWAWPLEFYKQAFFPLELVGVHRLTRYEWAPTVDIAHLEFRMPFLSNAEVRGSGQTER